MAVHATAGQRHETVGFVEVMNAVRIRQPLGGPRSRPAAIAGDKGYDYAWVRRWLRRRKIRPVIAARSGKCRTPDRSRTPFDTTLYRRRNVVERCVGWLKERRRIGTRFDKLAVNYLAMVKLAMIEMYLNRLHPDLSDRT